MGIINKWPVSISSWVTRLSQLGFTSMRVKFAGIITNISDIVYSVYNRNIQGSLALLYNKWVVPITIYNLCLVLCQG